MTPEVFAFLVLPAVPVICGIIGYAIIVFTNPERRQKHKDREPLATPAAARQ